MKPIVVAIAAFSCVAAFALEPVDKELIPEARRVLDYLESQYGKKTLSASTSGVAGWVLETTGRQPAIIGFDLSGWNSPTWGRTYTPVVEKTIADVQAWWQKGGLVQMQWHWKNPMLTNGSAWVAPPKGTGPFNIAAAVTPGSAEHKAFMADLARHADYLQKLADARVPVLWRPFHEIDGGWFWWTDKETPENTARLWRQMYDYLVKERKLHNLIWVYSAGVHAGGYKQFVKKQGQTETLEGEIAFRRRYYPGAEYVDIAGIDIYPGADYGPPSEDVYPRAFQIMQAVAPGKMLAMCESGVPLNPDRMAECGPKWLYNLQWFEGDPAWDRKFYTHEYIISFDELPVFTPHHTPPVVWLATPSDGATNVVTLRAEAISRDSEIARVEFRNIVGPWKNWFIEKPEARADTTLLGEVTAPPFQFEWKDAPAGFHNIVARATDKKGASAESNIARVSVGLTNLALGKTVTASSKPETAANAVDGNLFTAWASEKPGRKPARKDVPPMEVPTEQWLAVDLGAEQTIGGVSVSWWKAYAREYRIEVSSDGQAWKEVFHQPKKSEFCGNTDLVRFASVKARHVRLFCVRPGVDWGGYTVYELGVYASISRSPLQ